MKKLARFFVSVKKEMKKVRWPKKKEMLTYSIATLSFLLFFGVFFAFSDAIIAAAKMLVK